MTLASELISVIPCPQPISHSGMLHADTFTWLINLDKADIAKTLSSESKLDRVHSTKQIGPKQEPKHTCPTCSKSFHTKTQLSVHEYSAHGKQNRLRQLIQSAKCPICLATFAQIRYAKLHFQKLCGSQSTEQTLLALEQLQNVSNIAPPSAGMGNIASSLEFVFATQQVQATLRPRNYQ